MSQINLDTSPYFDDFDASKDYYKVLFKPGFPVQARELTTLQSILQNQISKFGEHFFKEGSMVIPGGVTYNPKYDAVILKKQQSGVDVSLYLSESVGKVVRGSTTGIKARIIDFLLPPNEGIDNPTIFVTYIDSGDDSESGTFSDDEVLILEDVLTYGNTTITPGSSFATTKSTDSTTVGSAANISDGVYFVRGTFIQVQQDTIILEPYVNIPSYRVGLQITEKIVTASQDNSLYDNAKGFNNFSAPGADRLQIKATLSKKPLDDTNDTNFIELLRVKNGEIKRLEENSDYNIIKDYLAQRTYDESGDYSVRGLSVTVAESLSDGLGNGGVYSPSQKTESGGTPSEDAVSVRVSAGKAYVRGYDIDISGTVNLDASKPRTTETADSTAIPFEMGSKYIVNNVAGTPALGLDKDNNIIGLYDQRLGSANSQNGEQIGEARVYNFGLEDSAYVNKTTPWELYLFDLQLYTVLDLSVGGAALAPSVKVRGSSSNATGYIKSRVGPKVTLTQVSGQFAAGEAIVVNGERFPITTVTAYKPNDVKSVFQDSSTVDPGLGSFAADTFLYLSVQKNFTSSDSHTITSGGDITCPGRLFNEYRVGDIVAYQKPGSTVTTLNRVTAVAANDLSITVEAVFSTPNVCDGTLPSADIQTTVRLADSRILNQNKSFLYAVMDEPNVSSVDLSNSQLLFTKQITALNVDSDGTMVVNSSNLNVDGALYVAFDQERYSVVYSDGSIAPVSSSQVTVSGNEIAFFGLQPSASGVTLNATAVKPSLKSKTKVNLRSNEVIIDKISKAIDGSTYGMLVNAFYGLRVDDEEISLNVADVNKVVAVYESLDDGTPTLDVLGFVSGLDLDTNTVKGEVLRGEVSGAIAQLVSAPTPETVRIVYLSQATFQVGERVTFLESAIKTNLQIIQSGNYNNITDKFTLDKGQREEFYDYARLVRNRNAAAPNKKLLVVYDQFAVPANDKGDFYTANSYEADVFGKYVPMLSGGSLRASDTLDFRPRVAQFTRVDVSPFDYTSRLFGSTGSTSTLVVAPSESIVVGYSNYVGRADRVVLDTQGDVKIIHGSPARVPTLPAEASNSMELARVYYPAYTYDVTDIKIVLIDNRRYTMRDIGRLEGRIENLEELTSLSLLERETESLQVLDADGNDRFKSGFFVDDFTTTNFIDYNNEDTRIDVATRAGTLVAFSEFYTLPLRLQLQEGIDENAVSLDQDVPLVDPNTRKTGDLVTLDYVEVEWIKQPLASRVENVNPFNVILYDGSISLTPRNDDFVVTRQIGSRRIDVFGESDSFTRTFVEGIEVAQFMRERNVSFAANGLKPHTTFYTFLDGASGVDVIPKLIEIQMDSGTFQAGETVRGFNGTSQVFSARVVAPNHKVGDVNQASRTFTTSPYNREETLPDTYSSASAVLNIDTISLADLSDDRFFGLISSGMRLVGSSSGAVASVSEIKLVSDTFGELFGCMFFRDPYASPTPAFRIETGIRTFRLSSSASNEVPVLGATTISFAETTYESRGTVQNIQTETVTIRDLPPPPPPVIIDQTVTNNFTEIIDQTVTNVIDRTVTVENNITEVVETIIERVEIRDRQPEWEYDDPLAQTFRVDETGAFLTAVDIFMATKSETDNLTVQVRPTELATPQNFLIQDFAEVVLSPDQVNVSEDGSVATRVVFPSPIYLEPEITYSIVLLAPTTNDYTAYIARMGEEDILGSDEGGSVIISQQYLNGSLFKSQNGSIWTPSQFEDLKFTLYKASFTNQSATVFLTNPPLGRQTRLTNNPIKTLPRKLRVPVSTNTYAFNVGDNIVSVSTGNPNDPKSRSILEDLGGGASTLSIDNGGVGFIDGSYTNVAVIPKTGGGEGMLLTITVSSGVVTNATITAGGTGYRVGDIVDIDNTTTDNSGGDASISITAIGDTDTLYLTNMSSEAIPQTDLIKVVDANGALVDTAVDVIDSTVAINPMYEGDVMILDLPVHGMEADTNIISIFGVLPDTVGSPLLEELGVAGNELVVQNPAEFATFEGITTATGYAYLGGEIIEYIRSQDGTINITERGVDGTAVNIHDAGSVAYRYELSGVSLRRINTEHQLPVDASLGNTRDINNLPIKIDRGVRITGDGQLNFNQEQQAGGSSARSSQNFQYNRILPSLGLLTPGSTTNIQSSIRTVSGTSAGGSEISFLDQGLESIDINDFNGLSTPRLVASIYNEEQYLQDLPQNKSLQIALTFSSTDQNLSPVIDMQQANAVLSRAALNKPIEDYSSDSRVNLTVGDPHSSIYISQKIDIENPATSLKVILSAYRDESADFRVLYRLFGPEAQGSTEPTWVLYPGYNNLLDTDGDGRGDNIIDPSRNNGLPNARVRSSSLFETLEYEYEVDKLPEFSGFQIKVVFSGTNEARSPFVRDIRAIALA